MQILEFSLHSTLDSFVFQAIKMAGKIQITNYLTRVLSDCVHIFSAGLQPRKQLMGYLTEPKCVKIARHYSKLRFKKKKNSADK